MKKHKCIWPKCKELTFNNYCELHYLAKEANYGIYDLENNEHYRNEEDKILLKRLAIRRLLNFSKYVLDNKII